MPETLIEDADEQIVGFAAEDTQAEMDADEADALSLGDDSDDAANDSQEDSSASDDAGSSTGANTGQPTEKPKGGDVVPKARFEEVYGKMRKAERERDEYKVRFEISERENKSLREAKEQAAKPVVEPEPKVEDFPSWEAHQEALVDYRVKRKLSEQQRQREEAEAQARSAEERKKQNEAIERFGESIRVYGEKHPEYVEAVAKIGNLPYSDVLFRRILGSKEAAEIDAYFYSDLSEFERINALPKDDAIEELAIVKARIRAKAKPAVVKPGATQQQQRKQIAPPPFRSPTASRAEVFETDESDPDTERYTIR